MTHFSLSKLTLVLGGANSGKSNFAENLCYQSGRSRVYIATAQAFDDEMREKIAKHRRQRGADWHTIEVPIDIAPALKGCDPSQVVLLDCATLWLTNVMLDTQDEAEAADRLLDALDRCQAPVIVVTNEVGQGIVPDTTLGRAFRSAQGRLNQRLAAQADTVVQVIAGLPQILKGKMS